MKKSLAILAAVGLASAAGAQGLEIEPGASVVAPGEVVTLTVFADPGPSDYAIAGVNFDVDASGGDWANPTALLSHPGQNPGVISGSSVTGASIGQLWAFGFVPDPGRIAVWTGDFSSATEGVYDISTATSRFSVYTDAATPGERRDVTGTGEGRATVEVIPAPASLALLGLGGLAAARRRR